ncbi:MAG TPA: CPBP family glutamic-type intramembrane protease [Pyrinomonadaceae bacterium]|jgi:membrane protease YdiL (CAAX protease family)
MISTTSNPDRNIVLWEIVSVLISCLIAQWTIHTFAGQFKWVGAVPIVLAIGLMLFSHWERGENLKDLGFRFDNFLPALRLLLLPTAIAIVLVILGSWWWSESGFSLRQPGWRFFLVPLWALVQQYGLQGFINRRAQLAVGPGLKSASIVGLAFCILHLPSLLLGVLALIGGFVWGKVYQREPNIFAVALSHTLVSMALSLSIPKDYANELRIGFKYFGMLI